MKPQTLGILLGGFVPAILFGLSAIFQKSSNQSGIGIGLYLLVIGFGSAITGTILYLISPVRTISLSSGLSATLVGIFSATGMGFVAIALARYGAPISKLVPLYNMNTLVAVLLGLLIFAEWRDVNALKLIMGSVLIVIGCVLVANS